MRFFKSSFSRGRLFSLSALLFFAPSVYAGSVTIQSPAPGADTFGPVLITASAAETVPFHLEVWDNGQKLGDFLTTRLLTSAQLAQGAHTTTVQAVTSEGVLLDSSTATYIVGKATPGTVEVASPAMNSTSASAVRITAFATEGAAYHLEVWDNGYKLGDIFSNHVDDVYVLPAGAHTLTVQSISPAGNVLDKQNVTYQVAETCSNTGTTQCDLDQLQVDNTQGDCDPLQENQWVANPCGFGVQGDGGADPVRTSLELVAQQGLIPNQGNLTLNGHALHLTEMQASQPSNVLFRSQSPTLASTEIADSHWTLDEYVYLPDPKAHQAFEMDAQYTINGVWTKFYTECAFNIRSGVGYWGVFDSVTGGWIFLNGQKQGGQRPPVVPCNRSQFSQPWPGSTNPTFTGWHHIAWNFLRNNDGTVTYQSLIFDGTTTPVNFHPNSATGGQVLDSGHFGALVQLDGVVNSDRAHDLVDAYISEISLTHIR